MEVQQQQQQQHYRPQQQLPDDFKCPISLEVMSDPVILTSGHTFDRSSIQRWLDSGNRTCPVTMLPLPSPALIPNYALRSLISNFTPACSSNSRQQPSPLPHHASPSNDSDYATHRFLLSSLTYPSDPQTLSQIRRLAKVDPTFRRLLLDSGAVSVILRHAAANSFPDLQEPALRALLELSLDGDDVKVGLVADGAVTTLVAVLSSPQASPSSRAIAATTLTSLAVADVNKCSIGAHTSAISALVEMLRQGSHGHRGSNPRERREAATALYALCSFPENRRRAVRAGAVPALVDLAATYGSERAIEVLGLIAKSKEGKQELCRTQGIVTLLAAVLKKDNNNRGTLDALQVLDVVCSDSAEMRVQALQLGVLEISLGLLRDENEKIKSHASRLVNKLQTKEVDLLL